MRTEEEERSTSSLVDLHVTGHGAMTVVDGEEVQGMIDRLEDRLNRRMDGMEARLSAKLDSLLEALRQLRLQQPSP